METQLHEVAEGMTCPNCAKRNIVSPLYLMNVSLDETITMCLAEKCTYPIPAWQTGDTWDYAPCVKQTTNCYVGPTSTLQLAGTEEHSDLWLDIDHLMGMDRGGDREQTLMIDSLAAELEAVASCQQPSPMAVNSVLTTPAPAGDLDCEFADLLDGWLSRSGDSGLHSPTEETPTELVPGSPVVLASLNSCNLVATLPPANSTEAIRRLSEPGPTSPSSLATPPEPKRLSPGLGRLRIFTPFASRSEGTGVAPMAKKTETEPPQTPIDIISIPDPLPSKVAASSLRSYKRKKPAANSRCSAEVIRTLDEPDPAPPPLTAAPPEPKKLTGKRRNQRDFVHLPVTSVASHAKKAKPEPRRTAGIMSILDLMPSKKFSSPKQGNRKKVEASVCVPLVEKHGSRDQPEVQTKKRQPRVGKVAQVCVTVVQQQQQPQQRCNSNALVQNWLTLKRSQKTFSGYTSVKRQSTGRGSVLSEDSGVHSSSSTHSGHSNPSRAVTPTTF